MSETTVNPVLDRACDIAAGKGEPCRSESGRRIKAAEKDLNCKGRGPWWYRMVWRGGSWQYFGDERLPMGTFLAADRRATVHGEVFTGEMVCSHDKGGPLDDVVYLVAVPPDSGGKCLVPCKQVVRQRDGNLRVVLPSGDEVIVPNPRKR